MRQMEKLHLKELAQTFRFRGATSEQLANVLATAPLVGDRSIFGKRTVKSTRTDGSTRYAVGFEPAPIPLLRFDVMLTQQRGDNRLHVVLEFTQPQRRTPYLAGQFVWLLEQDGDTAVLREEINTAAAMRIVDRPLHGASPSFRRFLFFAGGHQRLMGDVSTNVSALLGGT